MWRLHTPECTPVAQKDFPMLVVATGQGPYGTFEFKHPSGKPSQCDKATFKTAIKANKIILVPKTFAPQNYFNPKFSTFPKKKKAPKPKTKLQLAKLKKQKSKSKKKHIFKLKTKAKSK
jgi:hypothetical protein